jgi:hypothetical protein
LNRPEQCLIEVLYKQTRGDNKLDYSLEIGAMFAWITEFQPSREMELVDKILTVLCDPTRQDLCKEDIEDIICPYKENAE